LAAKTKAFTAGDNGAVASAGSNGVNSEAGGGVGTDGSNASKVTGSEGGGSMGAVEDGNGSGFISEKPLSGRVLTTSFAVELRDLDFFCALTGGF
jgi:hypothetical protein